MIRIIFQNPPDSLYIAIVPCLMALLVLIAYVYMASLALEGDGGGGGGGGGILLSVYI